MSACLGVLAQSSFAGHYFSRRSYENERSPVQNNEQRRPTGVIRQTKSLHIEVINIKSLTKYGVWLNAIITFTATKRAREWLPVPGRDARICWGNSFISHVTLCL